MKNYKKFLIFLFLFSLSVRVLFYIFFIRNNSVIWNFDSRVYRSVAEQIVNGKGISNANGLPCFYRVPGYSIFLALTSWNNNFEYSLWVQIFLSSFVPILIFFLARELFIKSKLLPYISAIVVSLHLGFVLFSGLALTESIFIILFLLFLNFFYRQKIFLSGIFLGLASMFRPVGHYLIFAVFFLIIIVYKNKLKKFLLAFLGWLVIVLPWLLRNFVLTGALFFSTLPGIHFLKHSAARIYMNINNTSYMHALDFVTLDWGNAVSKKEHKLKRELNPAEKSFLAEKISLDYFCKDFIVSLKHIMKNIFKTSFSLYSAELLFLDSGGDLPDYSNTNNVKHQLMRYLFPKVNNNLIVLIIYLEILFNIFLFIGFIGFIFLALYKKRYLNILVKSILFIFLFIFISLSCGFARLRLPIEPFLILLSFEFWLIFLKKGKILNYE